jgi:hypothetical protein
MKWTIFHCTCLIMNFYKTGVAGAVGTLPGRISLRRWYDRLKRSPSRLKLWRMQSCFQGSD